MRRLFAMHGEQLLAARPASPLVIVAMLAAYATWAMLLWVWLFPSRVPAIVVHATHGLVGPTLLASGIGVAIAFAILCGMGRLRARDLGLSRRGVVVGVIATAGCWAIAQLVLVVAALVGGDGVVASPALARDNGSELLGQLFGNAFHEEVVMRGFLFVQLVLIARRFTTPRTAWVAGALVAAMVFAVSHVPNRWISFDLHGAALAQNLMWLTWNGLALSIVYARTGHLEVAIGFHSLWNTPLPLFAAPIQVGATITAVQAAIVIAWPYLAPREPTGYAAGGLP